MEIRIDSAEQARGYNFSQFTNQKEAIKTSFPEATPLAHIFIQFDAHQDFENIIKLIETSVVPLLTGLSAAQLIELNATVRIIMQPKGKVVFEKKYSNVEEAELVFG